MARSRSRLAWMLVPIGLAVAAIAGVRLFMSFAASALHSTREAITSVMHSDPSPQWSDAVNRARRIIRAALVEQNLPGLSVPRWQVNPRRRPAWTATCRASGWGR